MKLFILTKGKLVAIGCCVLTLILTTFLSVRGISAVSTAAASSKKIPIYYVQKEEKVVSLSFDAAWGNEQTQDLLNISNHSNTHPHMSKLSKDKMKSEIEECNNKIEKIIGVKPILFRPPYGDYNNSVVDATNELNMYCMQWNIDSLDWKDPSPEQIKKNILNKIKPGSIILMHNGAKNTPEALPLVIESIINEGYSIVPISQIIYQCPYMTDHEGKQCPNS